ncbi:hypothetical protein MKW98_000040 [Papaver atlanticum]|uniref:Serine/threonine-protein kinase BSK1-like TPR repeats domain-containing protein n=1 Tax=Papaver atlanticum TaxID=357466 RepID=A0AAD4S916_9MAGN|nr:hypothetical protein MKW98_000040 [Papaver atlanticum]
MDHIAAATAIFLSVAGGGELNLLKESAATLDRLVGVGIPAILENTKDGRGRRAIHYAAIGGKFKCITSLSDAAVEGHLAAVEYLLEMGASPEILHHSNCTSLHHVALKGHGDTITMLLSKGINVDITNELGSPLQYATLAGKHDTVKVLLDNGANPNLVFCETVTPLQASVTSRSWQLVEVLLKAGADPNGGPDGIKALPLAAETGLIQIIKLLVDAGADPNVTNIRGLKPIEVAAVNDNRRGVEILFPVTSPIPSYDDWSINGIIKHVNSKEFYNKMICKEKANFLEEKSRGTSAFRRKAYWLALHWYSKALGIIPGDAAVLSNRSMCYVYLKEGDLALQDANQCMLKRPDWPKAYYRAGFLQFLLFADAFSNGMKLDPENKELEDAFREVSLDRLKAINVPI